MLILRIRAGFSKRGPTEQATKASFSLTGLSIRTLLFALFWYVHHCSNNIGNVTKTAGLTSYVLKRVQQNGTITTLRHDNRRSVQTSLEHNNVKVIRIYMRQTRVPFVEGTLAEKRALRINNDYLRRRRYSKIAITTILPITSRHSLKL